MKRNYIKEFLNCKTHNVKYSNQYPAAIDAQTYKNTLCNMISEKTLEICIMTKKMLYMCQGRTYFESNLEYILSH